MKLDDLRRELKEGVIRPVYLIAGKDAFAINYTCDLIKKSVLGEDGKRTEFSEKSFRCEQGMELNRVLEAAKMTPFFAKKQFILLKGIEVLTAEQHRALAEYMERPSSRTCVVMTSEDPGQHQQLLAIARKEGILVELPAPKEKDIPRWLMARAKKMGKELEPIAAHQLVSFVGTKLESLMSELAKVATFAGERKTITIEDVLEATSDSRASTIFELCDAIGENAIEAALASLRKLLDFGEAPSLILSRIAAHLRLIWKVKQELKLEQSPRFIGEKLGMQSWQLSKIIKQATTFSEEDMPRIFEMLADADMMIKSGKLGHRQILENLIISLHFAGRVRKKEKASSRYDS